MTRSETVKLEFRRYHSPNLYCENDLVAKLPGLLITQFAVPQCSLPGFGGDNLALRFDFVDDWYNVQAFLDHDQRPTGHYTVSFQTPLKNYDGVWRGDDLLLGLEVHPDYGYTVIGEEEFLTAVEEGWMRVFCAAKAREALRGICAMLDEGRLPQEVMDAVHG